MNCTKGHSITPSVLSERIYTKRYEIQDINMLCQLQKVHAEQSMYALLLCRCLAVAATKAKSQSKKHRKRVFDISCFVLHPNQISPPDPTCFTSMSPGLASRLQEKSSEETGKPSHKRGGQAGCSTSVRSRRSRCDACARRSAGGADNGARWSSGTSAVGDWIKPRRRRVAR